MHHIAPGAGGNPEHPTHQITAPHESVAPSPTQYGAAEKHTHATSQLSGQTESQGTYLSFVGRTPQPPQPLTFRRTAKTLRSEPCHTFSHFSSRNVHSIGRKPPIIVSHMEALRRSALEEQFSRDGDQPSAALTETRLLTSRHWPGLKNPRTRSAPHFKRSEPRTRSLRKPSGGGRSPGRHT